MDAKSSPRRRKTFFTGDEIELWFADEARVGQKNKITRRWAKRGTRPSAPRPKLAIAVSQLGPRAWSWRCRGVSVP
jgi:hypothetical protein